LQPQHLMQRHGLSPYLGSSLRGSVVRTLRRGETIFASGEITARTTGRFVRPNLCTI
jgi:dihydroorotase-like cyclic amidohydrolase